MPVREQDDLAAQFRQTVVFRAAAKYPDLLDSNSTLFRATWSAYYQHKLSNPAFFNDPDWPLVLANQTATALRIPSTQVPASSIAAIPTTGATKPKLIWTPKPAFPHNARDVRRARSGQFLLKFRSDGTVAGVETVKSTGNAVLDSSAAATFRLWRCEPGHAWSTTVPVTFEITRLTREGGTEPGLRRLKSRDGSKSDATQRRSHRLRCGRFFFPGAGRCRGAGRSNDLTVRPTSKLTPVRRPSPSLVLPRRRATRCRARRRCEPSGGSASWPGGRRCNQAGDRSQSRRR